MLTVRHFSEWLYYGFWYLCTNLVLALPQRLTCNDRWLRQPFLWIYQMGWAFAYLPTLAERQAERRAKASSNA